MNKSCVYKLGNKGDEVLQELTRNFGRKIATEVMNKVRGTDFLNIYKDSLSFIAEGIPSYDSIMSIKVVRDFIGDTKIIDSFNKSFQHLEDTRSNNNYLINKMIEFNKNHKDYTSYVDYDDEGKLTLKVEKTNDEVKSIAENQEKIKLLNDKILEILSPIGVTIEDLNSIEVTAGRVGETNFNHLKEVADNFTSLIRVANNMEGNKAISEEFSHLIIRLFNNTPIVQRTLNYLSNENNARQILGNDYDDVSDYYNNDVDMIAEEAAGHLLRDAMLNKQPKQSLLKRFLNFIISKFKGINPAYYQDNINNIQSELSKLASDIITNKKVITKQDIKNAESNKSFNALSEKVDKQIDVLKDITERMFKTAALQQNLDDRDDLTEKAKARKSAEFIYKTIHEKQKDAESMEAIAAYLDIANKDLKELYKKLGELDGYNTKDKFTILRNTLWKLQAMLPTLKDLGSVTTKEYINDEEISKQHFLVDEGNDSLKDVESLVTNETIDTSDMTSKEIADLLTKSDWVLTKDGKYYYNKKTKEKALRVTKTIEADKNADESFDENSPWVTPSTNIGTGIDELTRDFFSNRLEKQKNGLYTINDKKLSDVYPNASNTQLNKYVAQLQEFKDKLTKKGITIIPRDVTINGTIQTIDDADIVHTVNVAGTLDLIGYDKDGNWHIYDMKTHRSKLSISHKRKYARQLSLYKKFIEDKYGITIKDINIIPISVHYDAPIGVNKGKAEYKVSSENKNEDYNGIENNQLLKDGEEYKDARPKLEDVIELNEKELNIDYKKLSGDKTGGLGNGKMTIIQGIQDLNSAYTDLSELFNSVAMKEFVAFLKPFIGETVKIRDKNGELKDVSIKKVIEEKEGDISMLSRLLSTMADSSDMMLQMFDRVYKRAKAEHRFNTIEKIGEIKALGKLYENKGITSYDWMFEEDKANYINHIIIKGENYSYDKSKYEKAKNAYFKLLDEKYGEHPEINSKEYKEKYKAKKKWINDNTVKVKDEFNNWNTFPNGKKYPSRYNSLTKTQQEFYDKWMAIKGDLDMHLGDNKISLTNTIKIRKSNIERIKDNDIMGSLKAIRDKTIGTFTQGEENNTSTNKVQQGFNGEEIMKLPLYFVYGDTNDLSTDAISTLCAYAEMAYNYDAMNSIVNPLEIGRELAKHRKITLKRKGLEARDKFKFGSRVIDNPIYVTDSNITQQLNDFFESKIYNRFYKDLNINIFDKNVDLNKAGSLLLKLGSMCQLGFNMLANIANIGTGIGVQNIEAAAGQFFNARELASADIAFTKELGSYVGNIGQRINNSKLSLFQELFDVKQDYKKHTMSINWMNKTVFTRIFGPALQFFGQEAGDFWLYNRTAIAMAKRYKLKDKNGNSISLWDALEKVPIDKTNTAYKLQIKEGVIKEDGTKFNKDDIFKFGSKVNFINKHLFGVYSDEDMIAMRRTIIGRFIMQYRDWIPSALIYRFQGRTQSLEGDVEFEGYYHTLGRVTYQLYKDLKNGEANIGQVWNQLNDMEKANIKRCLFETSQIIALSVIAYILANLDKDKKRGWLISLVNYIAQREQTELGALHPVMMGNELIQMVNSPFAATNIMKDIQGLSNLLLPWNYFDNIEAGDYKDHSTAYKSFMKSPLTLWYRNIKRSLNPDKAATWYNQ